MKVRCIQLKDWAGEPEAHSAWLKVGGVYHVLRVQVEPTRTMLHLVGEEPTPALFQPELFEIVSATIPSNWVVTSPRPGHLEFAPAAWSRTGFWEDYYDRVAAAVSCFEEERRKIVASDP